MSQRASTGCALDPRGCISLECILLAFSAPISEEQAWALCYTTIQCFFAIRDEDKSKATLSTSLKHVILHKDGYVHEDTFMPNGNQGRTRVRPVSEGKLVSELGVLLYRALDYSLGSDEERDLSPSLNHLIDLMTSAGTPAGPVSRRRCCAQVKRSECERGETDDEGIERDSGDSEDEMDHSANFTMSEALQVCESRLSNGGLEGGVCEHYRAVVRALVAEAIDLASFLQNVALGSKFATQTSDLLSSEHDLRELQCEDWARLWMQVMRELRNGVKLKKFEYSRGPIEYALTPYEMLMDDIRSRRYTLNKVMVNGDIPPRLKKDAHTIILDFIRSRPPLRKASERKLLPPPRKISSPMELLMESIRKDHTLKHVNAPTRTRPMSMVETSRSPVVLDPTPKPQRKLIQAPRFNISAEDEEEDDLSDIPPSSPHLSSTPVIGTVVRSPTQTPQSTPSSPWSRMAFDLAKYGNTGTPERRHSITLCETPSLTHQSSTSITPPSSLPQSRNPSAPSSPAHQDFISSTSQTQRDFLSSAHFSTRLDCLALTLEEVVHIRNVLTKADLEALPLDLTIKEDMAKGKICFLCMKTRFGFFGPRGTNCRLCKRTVCKKCISKMRIPTEHFSNIPVQMLTPQALSPREDEEDNISLPRSILSRLTFNISEHIVKRIQVTEHGEQTTSDHILSQELPLPGSSSAGVSGERRSSITGSVGSAPSSPTLSRTDGPLSLPTQPAAPYVNEAIKKPKLGRANTLSVIECRTVQQRLMEEKQKQRSRTTQVEEHLRGELMSVCGDCKAMVLHILASIKVRREQQMSGSALHESPRHHLHLNLNPVYH
ncbi:protein spire homolog 1 isoform X2 [Cherax quadricarinatus]|uniref:protein spire homolog 1 isoform X2 n=1 Tax=Cherax quadricarinatus TaxID=27406 RepID=UPI002379C667|nr:protein spire homolog 1-like isoform X2 [Cherax quadricarinatus]